MDLNYNIIIRNANALERLASINCTGNEQSIRDCSIITSDLSSEFRIFFGIPAGIQCIGKKEQHPQA